ncbi:MAG: hypothetical protein O3A85_04335 [Proteobacteria bacterium]|nr:hypothetical protein [Pseudomonadota bacterium]
MRFHAELDLKSKHWLVFDAGNRDEIVGVHVSGTLAALDAMKREQDVFKSEYLQLSASKPEA